MRLFKLIITFLCAFLIASCATRSGFNEYLNNWKGEPIEEFIANVNYIPVRILSDTDGGKMHMFAVERKGQYTTPATTTGSYTDYGGSGTLSMTTTGGQTYTIESECVWTMRTDSEGIIKSWTARGSACRN